MTAASSLVSPGSVADDPLLEQTRRVMAIGLRGRVERVTGLTAAVAGFPAPMGGLCSLTRDRGDSILAEVIGFHGHETLLQPYGDPQGLRRGNVVELVQSVPHVRFGDRLRGRVVNALGSFIDGQPPTVLPHRVDLRRDPVRPLERPRIAKVLGTGVRVIDSLLTLGEGQRMGIFAGSGVGKSTLMGMLARHSSADVNVVVLVGERGREVREFIEKDLGPKGSPAASWSSPPETNRPSCGCAPPTRGPRSPKVFVTPGATCC